jgi:lactate dehydrogenase-like 2-hydroxyacid dehydrogenase
LLINWHPKPGDIAAIKGRLIVTPHSAFFTPEAWDDTRLKAAETMRAALVGPRPQNVITPEMF